MINYYELIITKNNTQFVRRKVIKVLINQMSLNYAVILSILDTVLAILRTRHSLLYICNSRQGSLEKSTLKIRRKKYLNCDAYPHHNYNNKEEVEEEEKEKVT